MTTQKIKLKAQGHWVGGVKASISIPNHKSFETDMPQEMGGTDAVPCPMEYLLGSLMGCELATMANVAKQMKFNYQGVEMVTEGDIDPRGMQLVPGVKPYFQEVRQIIKVKTGESQERLEQLRQQTESRCPAFNLLKDVGAGPYVSWELLH